MHAIVSACQTYRIRRIVPLHSMYKIADIMPTMSTVQLMLQYKSDTILSTNKDETWTPGASRITDLDSAIRTGVGPQELLAVVRLCCRRMVRESSSLSALNSSRGPQAREMVA